MRSLDLDHNLHEYFLGLGMNYFKGILSNMLRQSRNAADLQRWLQQALPATTVFIPVPQQEYQPPATHLKHFTAEPPENPDQRIELPASPDNFSDISNPAVRAGLIVRRLQGHVSSDEDQEYYTDDADYEDTDFNCIDFETEPSNEAEETVKESVTEPEAREDASRKRKRKRNKRKSENKSLQTNGLNEQKDSEGKQENKSLQTNGLNIQSSSGSSGEKENKLLQANGLNVNKTAILEKEEKQSKTIEVKESKENESQKKAEENATSNQVNDMFKDKSCEEILKMIREQVEVKFDTIWKFNFNNLRPDQSFHFNYWVNLDGFKVYIDEPFKLAPIDFEYSFKGLCNVPYHKLLLKQQLLMTADRSENDTSDLQKCTNKVWYTTPCRHIYTHVLNAIE